nr:penicillin-binding protein activator LpoB [uncultured Sphingomonas sp.]
MRLTKVSVACALLTGLALPTGALAQAAPQGGARELDPSRRGIVSGVGVESQDIIALSDRMMRDLLTVPEIAGRKTPPRIIVDAAYFTNESSQRLNKNLITDRLRVALNRASRGRMVFLARANAAMIEEERSLKREGATDVGTVGMTRAQFGSDYRLTGNIASLDSRSRSGVTERFTQITLEMVDLESGAIAWSNTYDIDRAATDDVSYR